MAERLLLTFSFDATSVLYVEIEELPAMTTITPATISAMVLFFTAYLSGLSHLRDMRRRGC
jgi:hypothetical protein